MRPSFASPKSPPQNRFRDHSPTKSSPLRHTLSTLSNHSDVENSSVPSRHGTLSSNASSTNAPSSGYDSPDPFVVAPRTSSKRDRSESPVKKNSAFAQWEQREQAAHVTTTTTTPKMDVSPKKVRDDEWRSGLGRSESRAALRPVELNTRSDSKVAEREAERYSPSKENREYVSPSRDTSMPPPPRPPSHSRGQSEDSTVRSPTTWTTSPPPVNTTTAAARNSLATLSRSDSMRGSTKRHTRFASVDAPLLPQLDGDDIATLQKSSTPQLRHLSTMAASSGGVTDELSVHSPDEQVVGLAGRRKLQRSDPTPKKLSSFASQYASTRWMDTQRKHLAAYEYLCHIGEARLWLQDVLSPIELPPIVVLEEALRDGVTLAETVARLSPAMTAPQQRALGSLRIFRNPRLQYRHSDNIALFFRFLAEVELPELFRFELVDLYEKKNVPKVIYCIHALSWLLFRQGLVDFRIGNLVGTLQFEEHELEATQRGIEKSGVAMPNFGGMREALQVEPEPAEPEPTDDEILAGEEAVVQDLQAQSRGALIRLRLGAQMQELWDAEASVALLQSLARGGFAREVFAFKAGMDDSTRRFQAAAKGFLARYERQRRQRGWQLEERKVVTMQRLWRGRQQRVETKGLKMQLRRAEHGVRGLQAAMRGALGRWQVGDVWHETREAGGEVAAFQAQARGMLERARVGGLMNELWDVEDTVIALQARVRGGRVRRGAKQQSIQTRHAAVEIVRLQALARGLLQRRERKQRHAEVHAHGHAVTDVQAAARGLLARLRHARTLGALQGREPAITKLQTLLRGQLARTTVRVRKAELLVATSSGLEALQSVLRGRSSRQQTSQLREALAAHTAQTTALQALARAMLCRRRIGTQLAALEEHEAQLEALQALARAYLARQRVYDTLMAMEAHEDALVSLQGLARGMLLRSAVGGTLAELEEEESSVAALQTVMRGWLVRRKFVEKREHYRENMRKVIKLQSFVRAKQQGESYRSLVGGKNPPLPVVRRHLHLLTDSSLEFEGELEAERLRRQVVESVRRNELVEGYVEGLDTKIALLVKQKITLDEVVRHQKHFGGSASQLLRPGATLGGGGGGVDLKALNKSSRKKLTGYEELFFILQTQGAYLARLLQRIGGAGLAEKEGKNLERLVMTLFGYAQKSREEYFLLRMLGESAHLVIAHAQTLEECARAQAGAFGQRLVLSYLRSPSCRGYLKQLLGGLVKNDVCGQEHLDLESDPLQIYRAILNSEELSTGMASQRPRDLPREVAIREHDVRPTYVQHLQDLRDICDGFFLALEEHLHRMPFGVRFLATEQYRALSAQFPREDPGYIASLAGLWLWKSYLLPAFREPEMWGVVDRGLSPVHKRNLSAVVTVLGQVTAGRLFGAENLYLQPLNNWVSESLERWHDCLQQVFDLPSMEEHFDADSFSDLYARTKPTLYIKLADIFSLHSMITENLSSVAPAREDPLRELLTDLGTAKGNESDMSGATASGGEITLTLKSRFTVQEDPNAEARALFTATKRLVLYIIKVQSGSNLMEIMCRPISHEDAEKWVQVVREELAEKDRENRRPNGHGSTRRGAPSSSSSFDPRASLRGGRAQSVYSEAPSSFSEDRRDGLDLEGMTYAELKHNALENILALEQPGIPPQFRVSRHNNYQDLLNALAADIRQKHRRRLERAREVDSTRATLAQLDAKARFLEDQLKTFNDYIEQCLHTLASQKGRKHKFTLPFTKQWSHERELERAGRQPKFGSYKYSARQLADKGVLLSWAGYASEHWGQLNIVISSDEVGVFHLEGSSGSMMLPGASANVLLDELLQAQYENQGAVKVFDEEGGEGGNGGARLAVNLLLHLVFKRFYRDE